MQQSNHTVHEHQPLRRAESPAFGQHQVVDVFQTDAGHLPKDVERVEDFLQIDQTHGPRSVLVFDDRFERGCGGPMPSAGVEIDEINIVHYCFIAASHPCYTRGLKI